MNSPLPAPPSAKPSALPVVTTAEMTPLQLPPLGHAPLVSVLIVNYNYEHFLSDAIESVLKQTYQNFEIVICDDGSKDNSRELISEYARKDARVKPIFKENGGVA